LVSITVSTFIVGALINLGGRGGSTAAGPKDQPSVIGGLLINLIKILKIN
jgi:hypothetical protein